MQTIVYSTRTKFSICFATAYPIISLILSLCFGALGIVVTGIAIAGQDVCENFNSISIKHINSYNNSALKIPFPVNVIIDSEYDLADLYELSSCESANYTVSLPELSCAANNAKSNICANFVPYFASGSYFLHAYLISLIGFTFVIIIQRAGMISDSSKPQFGKIKSSSIKSPVRKSDEVFDQASSDDADTDSYQIDHNHVGYL